MLLAAPTAAAPTMVAACATGRVITDKVLESAVLDSSRLNDSAFIIDSAEIKEKFAEDLNSCGSSTAVRQISPYVTISEPWPPITSLLDRKWGPRAFLRHNTGEIPSKFRPEIAESVLSSFIELLNLSQSIMENENVIRI
jgi:hypothetical protein